MPASEQTIHRSGSSSFQSRSFRNYQVARFLVILGSEAQAVAVAWHIYQLTQSPLLLGSTGLALFLPSVLFVLPAGHTADRYNRKHVILICYALQFLCSAALLAITYAGVRNIAAVYGLLFFIGLGRAFSGPASSAILPQLVPKEDFLNAMTWGSAIFQTANISGPALGGLVYSIDLPALAMRLRDGLLHSNHFAGLASWIRSALPHGAHPISVATRLKGAPTVYVMTLLTLLCYLALVSTLRPREEATEKKAFSMEAMLVGMRYVRNARLLLGSTSLDMFAVLLGGAVSLLPVFAENILHIGPRGLGLLRAAPAIGALLMSMTLARFPIRHHAGRLMLVCVGIFGAATVGFGLSRSVPLSLFLLILIGAADNVSVIVRSSIVQMGTPPQMRGRVSAVNALFLGTSNEFGEFESGATAQWLGAVRAVVLGGFGSMVITGLWSWMFPALRRVDTLTTEELLAANASSVSEPIN